MNKEELAAKLNGRPFDDVMTDSESKQAKSDGLIVVFGYSDDNTEFRGAIYDEAGAYGGHTHYVAKPLWLLPDHDKSCECPFCQYEQIKKTARTIEARWNKDGYSWTFETDIPYASFDILEDGKKFCRGIVFNIADL